MNILIAVKQALIRKRFSVLLKDEASCIIREAVNEQQLWDICCRDDIDIAFIDVHLDQKGLLENGFTFPDEPPVKRPSRVVVLADAGELGQLQGMLRLEQYAFLAKNELTNEKIKACLNSEDPAVLLKGFQKPPAEQAAKINGYVIGNSYKMGRLLTTIKRVAKSDRPVLIVGPTGSGKEMVAQLLHQYSNHFNDPVISINCGAIPENLMESELFGYERGAFTGAFHRKPGYCKEVGRGTLFLDEIAELPLLLQAKLLRVLESGFYYPVGSVKEQQFKGRIVAATHRELRKLVEENFFREDLYYRLNVFVVEVPSLNERREDIPELVRCFSEQQQRGVIFSDGALQILMQSDWPGNVRQLKSIVERISVLCDVNPVTPEEIRKYLAHFYKSNNKRLEQCAEEVLNMNMNNKLASVEHVLIEKAMVITGGNKSAAARLLGVHRKFIERRQQRNITRAEEIDGLYKKGLTCNAKSDYKDAIRHLRRGLLLLNKQPETEAVLQQKLEFLIQLSIGLRSTKGWNSARALTLYEEVKQLATRQNKLDSIAPIFFGLWVSSLIKLELKKGVEFAQDFLQIGLKNNNADIITQAYISLANTYLWMGEFPKSLHALEKFRSIYIPGSEIRIKHGQDSYVLYLLFLCINFFHLGYFQKSRQILKELTEYQKNLNHPFSTVLALQAGAWLEYLFGNYQTACELSDNLIKMAEENNFLFYRGIGLFFKGAALAETGEESGLAMMREGRQIVIGEDGKILNSLMGLASARYYCLRGDYEKSLRTIDAADKIARRHNERCYLSELTTLRGICLKKRLMVEAAEIALETALSLARELAGGTAEMLASIELADLYLAAERLADAQEILTKVLFRYDDDEEFYAIKAARNLLNQSLNRRVYYDPNARQTYQERT